MTSLNEQGIGSTGDSRQIGRHVGKNRGRRGSMHCHATIWMPEAIFSVLGLILILPVLEKFAYMARMDVANVFDFDILLDRICLAKTYAGVASESDGVVDRYDLYRFLGHAAVQFSFKITGSRVRSLKINYCMLGWCATAFAGSPIGIRTNAAESC